MSDKFFALLDNEIGVMGVGTTWTEAVRHYAEHMMTESEHEDTLKEQIAKIQRRVEAVNTELRILECTEALYSDFLQNGNQGSYDHRYDGVLDLLTCNNCHEYYDNCICDR